MAEEKTAAKPPDEVKAPAVATPNESGTPLPGERRTEDYDLTVRQMVNEMAQVAAVPIELGDIGAVSIIAVSPGGEYVGSNIVEKIVPTGDITPETQKIIRKKISSRLQLLTELQKQIDALRAQLLDYIS